jgi:oligopeptide/dipeptide ABC transporter ATP-binding protein
MTEALALTHVTKHFHTRAGLVRAVDDVSFSIHPGETMGLVGESGSGKSTVGKLATALLTPTSGEVAVDGTTLTGLSARQLREKRRDFNIVFQDPTSSLNPRMTVGQIVAEPLIIHGTVPHVNRRARVRDLLAQVGLGEDMGSRYVHALSGGQRQRVSLARALASEPKLLVADEPTSALDVSVQASVLNLIADLRETMDFACLFISHDLSAVEYLADRIAVMYLGQIVELTDRQSLFAGPLHPYSEILLEAAPLTDPRTKRARIVLEGDQPSPLNIPPGCRFHPRCPLATDRCRQEVPELRTLTLGETTTQVSCHLVADDGTRPQLTSESYGPRPKPEVPDPAAVADPADRADPADSADPGEV